MFQGNLAFLAGAILLGVIAVCLMLLPTSAADRRALRAERLHKKLNRV